MYARSAALSLAAALLLAGASAATPRAGATPWRRMSPSRPAPALADGDAPWFCHDLDCPSFQLVKNLTDIGIELRHYPAAKWVSTKIEGKGYDGAVATGFWRLFKYISGNNKDAAKVEMTAPVTVKVNAGQGPACNDTFTISFFVPPEHQSNPPAPSDETVFIERRAALTVYVASFGGWAKGSTYRSHAADAADALEDAGESVAADWFYTAGYDSPFRLTGRHNEVWLPAAAAPSVTLS